MFFLFVIHKLVKGGVMRGLLPCSWAALCLFIFSNNAASITLTGAELLSNPNISFPAGTPNVNGSSIVFQNGGQSFDKLMVIDLYSPGELSGNTPTSFSVSINMTRLACVPNPDCPADPYDWDPHIMLTDGTNLLGAVISNNNNGDALIAELDDLGDIGTNRTLTPLFTNAGFPDIGSSIDIDVTFTLDDTSTGIDVSFLSGSGQFISNTVLDYTAPIKLVLLRDNDIGEEYQLNTLTLPTVVPIPAAAWLFGSVLLGLIGVARRRADA
jgi:hypothetical protein